MISVSAEWLKQAQTPLGKVMIGRGVAVITQHDAFKIIPRKELKAESSTQ